MYLQVMCGQRRPRSDCAHAQSDQGLSCPQTESLDIVECFNGKEMSGWGFAHVRNDVTTHIFLMFEGIFLLDATKFFFPVGIFIPFGISEGGGVGGWKREQVPESVSIHLKSPANGNCREM